MLIYRDNTEDND